MNIGNWMSDEQMSLIKDRRSRGTNKRIVERKSMQYNDLVGTPHQSDDEDEDKGDPSPNLATGEKLHLETEMVVSPSSTSVSGPAPEFSHSGPSAWSKSQHAPSSPELAKSRRASTSHHPEPMRTRLAMSSMISYFNDRVLTPEMMRAMIILYIGPHNRPDFTQDYLLCPILAPDVLLARFPKTYFLTGERDPLVDDTVIFAGRLRRVKAAMHASGGERMEYQDEDANVQGFDEKRIAEVALLPGISHGFLQFPTIYPPAWKLMDRAASWIGDAFAEAKQRGKETRRALVNGARTKTGEVPAEGRHHMRRESSDVEDKPLEMSMTKARVRSMKEDPAQVNGDKMRENGGTGSDSESETETETGEARRGGSMRGKKRKKKSLKRDPTLVKLKSSDDLLGRRMQGLAGGLTGLPDDE